VCKKFKWHDVATYYLGGIAEPLPVAAESAYLKALFHQGRFREFAPRLAKNAGKLNDPEIPLYELALRASSSDTAGNAEAEAELERLSNAGGDTDLATRLHMIACGEKGNVTGYGRSLQRLSLRNQDNVSDHALYWVLLGAAGRKAEAVKLAESFTRAPASAVETVRLAEGYYQLGMLEASRTLLQRFAPSFAQAPEVWVAYGSVLEKLEDWSGMRSIALQIREDLNGRDTLWGYAYYLEGRAEWAERRLSSAERAFEKAAESFYEIPPLGSAVAKGLTRLKAAHFALRIFSRLEKMFPNDLSFWESYFDAAFSNFDSAAVLKTSAHCFKLNPKDQQVHNRYAAALLVNRTQPEEVIRLTLELVNRHPNSFAAQVNHAFALLLNRRPSEALALLEKISPANVSPSELSGYYLALFEANYNLARWEEAEKASEKVVRSTLFPTQRQWLDAKRKELPSHRMAGK
jgi:tetratricopeptide (TPR) repeat protein